MEVRMRVVINPRADEEKVELVLERRQRYVALRINKPNGGIEIILDPAAALDAAEALRALALMDPDAPQAQVPGFDGR